MAADGQYWSDAVADTPLARSMTGLTQTRPTWHDLHEARLARRLREEWINTLTHAIGCALGVAAVVGLIVTVVRHGNGAQIFACVLYGAALISVYLASSLSHALHQSRWRQAARMLDQAFIFLLIAGTFMPPAMTYLPRGRWWIVPAVMWGIALAGFISKAFFAHRVEAVTARLHLLLGWMPVLAAKPLILVAPVGMFAWFVAGGVCYTLGTLFLHRDHLPYFHAVWHLLVIAGSICHFIAIWVYCTAPLA